MSNFVFIPCLMLGLATSLLVLACGAWQIVIGKDLNRLSKWFVASLFVLGVSSILVDAFDESKSLSGAREILSHLSCLAIFSGALFCAKLFLMAREKRPSYWLKRQPWLIIVIGLSMTAWCYQRMQHRILSYNFTGIEASLPGEIDLAQEAFGATDEGTRIPLYRMETDDESFGNYIRNAEIQFTRFHQGGILRADADKMANCHGWVFTGGRFLLKGPDVDRILCDNQYNIVSEPQSGDLVIYRDSIGQILHTALVQSVLLDGTVITESKWGTLKRFLHRPNDQPYSAFFQYYRTNRPSHVISIRKSSAHSKDCYADSKLKESSSFLKAAQAVEFLAP